MQYKRIYVDQPLDESMQLTLDKETAHYLTTVLRCRSGEKLIVFNGLGGSYRAQIEASAKRSVSVSIGGFIADERRQSIEITLAYAISKGSHMDYAIQKAVELGVMRIAPLFSARGNVSLTENRVQSRYRHWHKIIVHACEQSGRNHIPELLLPQSYKDWLAKKIAAKKLLFSVHSDSYLEKAVPADKQCVLLLGPEGGLSHEEEEMARSADYKVVSLGQRTLRTETAVAAAMTAVQVLWGDMGACYDEE